MTLKLVQGDAKVPLRGTLTDDTGAPLDITGCQVYFQMRRPTDRLYTINALCENLDEPNGIVRYITGANDLNGIGDFQGQFEVRYGDGTILTTQDPVDIQIRRQ